MLHGERLEVRLSFIALKKQAHHFALLHHCRLGFLKPSVNDPAQLDFSVIRASPKSSQPFTWAEKDAGEAVLALMKNYRNQPEKVLSSKFYVVSQRIEMGEFVDTLSRGWAVLSSLVSLIGWLTVVRSVLEKKVNYVHVETTGSEAMDQVVSEALPSPDFPPSLFS